MTGGLRARKNAWNRDKGVERLRRAYAKGTLTKENITKCGYNKFLDISKDINVSINEGKIEEDMLWDGLKGYITVSLRYGTCCNFDLFVCD